MAETLLSPSGILLYGRELTDIKLVVTAAGPPATINPHDADKLGSNELLRHQLETQLDAGGGALPIPTLARIYGFSFEGHYYDIVRPAIFVVHGPGVAVDATKPPTFRSRAPAGVDVTGVGTQDYQFSDDMTMWEYDKADYSIRLDVETGMFEQILLEAELDEESIEAFYSGQRARVSGQRARVSGQRARVSGQRARTRDRGD